MKENDIDHASDIAAILLTVLVTIADWHDENGMDNPDPQARGRGTLMALLHNIEPDVIVGCFGVLSALDIVVLHEEGAAALTDEGYKRVRKLEADAEQSYARRAAEEGGDNLEA